jgi:hypothetical protein
LEVGVLPRLVVRVRRAVRHVTGLDAHEPELSGERNVESWDNMIAQVRGRDREYERRLRRAEQALNQLSLQ